MADENPSIIHHISIGTNDFDRAIAFYDQVMSTIGAKRVF
ncbi:MAG: VOC family protein, partial [Gammaproteobacteria bacterium]|nr:VOC family protein [Gammaproteobacteria bacterium]